jgi:hypothetical protein
MNGSISKPMLGLALGESSATRRSVGVSLAGTRPHHGQGDRVGDWESTGRDGSFVRAPNLAHPNDGHMHNVTMKFLDNDHFTAEWTFWKDQKASFQETFAYTRKR